MFKIFVLAMSVATGHPIGMFVSNAAYETKEACDAIRLPLVESLKAQIEADNPGGVDVQSKCDVEGTPS